MGQKMEAHDLCPRISLWPSKSIFNTIEILNVYPLNNPANC